ncbi:3-hydroxyacyl-CoA dehydrogenase [Mameliella alba]|uniref:3-hydroxyacyl-CoA dehydrogenase n=1 Tax=Mameliella alba TaxID=561184 RepID=UPI000B53360F|nr:3-hydroxyacyl-CoA dehydrogenase [Mameliella alba]MBY6120903.1 3-hydroxyacyl-CoA dehydrogenase [Mameliella alba]OWV42544.1 3-hydroxyacyl-CoA dehydrogenase [Mameliella alba]OWV63320.1 3-hydroxyacyl-CoA dehydrogenase [Mameliella alba]
MTETIAIIGAGLIGRSWSVLFARAGYDVQVWDVDPAVLERFPRDLATLCDTLQAEELLEDRAGTLARVRTCPTLEEAVTGVSFVQENGPERIEVKEALFARLDAAAPPEAVLASSTSAIVPSRFTEGLNHRGRCLVGHPVNPPHLVPVVELCPAPWTTAETMDRAEAIYTRIGQVPVRMSAERDGFVLNRLQGALLAEALRLLGEGVVSVEGLDATIKHGLGLRWALMGPIETIDLNAPGGLIDYATRYGPFFAGLAETPAGPEVFSVENAEKIAATWPQDRSPDSIRARQDRRDRRLAGLRRHLMSDTD